MPFLLFICVSRMYFCSPQVPFMPAFQAFTEPCLPRKVGTRLERQLGTNKYIFEAKVHRGGEKKAILHASLSLCVILIFSCVTYVQTGRNNSISRCCVTNHLRICMFQVKRNATPRNRIHIHICVASPNCAQAKARKICIFSFSPFCD